MKNLLRNVTLSTVLLLAVASLIAVTSTKTSGTTSYAADDGRVLMADGRILVMRETGWIVETDVSPSPVPANQVAYFGGLWLIDTNGNGWVWNRPWVNIGPPPGGPPIAIQSSTWSQIKTTVGN